MTDNEKIAKWAGVDYHICTPEAFHCDGCANNLPDLPDYPNDSAACFGLLDVLVSKPGQCPFCPHIKSV